MHRRRVFGGTGILIGGCIGPARGSHIKRRSSLSRYCGLRSRKVSPDVAASIPLRRARKHLGIRRVWEAKRKQLVAITGSRDFSYFANINIGGQPFNVALDTGSADLWIQSQGCTASDCLGAASYMSSPNLLKLTLPFNIGYLSGNVVGQLATDIVRLAQYEISNQVFGLASDLKNMTLASIGVSGMLGLGFPSIATIPTNQGLPVIFNIVGSLPSQQQFFAFRLGRDEGPNPTNSSFNIGQHDSSVQDPSTLHYMPVFPKNLAANAYDYWKVPLDAIIVNGATINLTSSKIPGSRAPIAVFDTGTSLMLGPPADVDAVYHSLSTGNAQKTSQGQWTVNCLLAVDMILIIGGRAYPIHPLDFAWDMISDGSGQCFGGLQANDDVISGDFLFGDTVMRNIYTEHYFETENSPPLLALLGTTTPSQALREFVQDRGPNFILGYGATFSDAVLDQSYPSSYSTTAAFEGQANSSSSTQIHFPMHFYKAAQSQGQGVNSSTEGSLHATIFLVLATTLGFTFGSLATILMRKKGRGYGHTSHVLQKQYENEERDFYDSLGLKHPKQSEGRSKKNAGTHSRSRMLPLASWMKKARRDGKRSKARTEADEPDDTDEGEATPMIG